MADESCFTSDFREQPYWWDAAAPMPTPVRDLPKRVDVVIVGSGVTGTSAALTLARGGRDVLVLDSNDPGFGASRRNFGILNRRPKASFHELERARGAEFAERVYREQYEALQSTIRLIRAENIDCHLDIGGRYVAATSPDAYKAMEADLAFQKERFGWDYRMVPKSQQLTETSARHYFGGAVLPDLGSLHPGLFHKGLVDRAIAAGAIFQGRTPVTSLARDAGRGKVVTDRGELQAAEIVVATNGYTPRELRWFSRRIIPFTGYVATTEILPDELIQKALPAGRPILNSHFDQHSLRRAPDSPRLLVCGATGSGMREPRVIAETLQRILRTYHPELEGVRFYRVWSGECAAAFDMKSHIGRRADGVRFAMAYNFGGMLIGTYFGRKLGEQILGVSGSETVFEQLPFKTAPLYAGNPWFVPYAMRYFNFKDRWKDARSISRDDRQQKLARTVQRA
jgi:glycine/D-amino acid oxidase-like deaminating enzyme